MQVRDVIEKLSKCDPYMEVVIEMPRPGARLEADIDVIHVRGGEVIIEVFE